MTDAAGLPADATTAALVEKFGHLRARERMIAAEAARQERHRIRELAVQYEAKYLVPCDEHDHRGTLHTHHRALFARLLEDAP